MCRCYVDIMESSEWCGVQQKDGGDAGGPGLQDVFPGEDLDPFTEA